MVTILVLFDFSKAFDRVDHAILLEKMRKLNLSCSVLNWFHSYLSNRRQAVRDTHGNLSSWATVRCGVPQGSVLGPLLFSIFVNDLPHNLKHTKYMLYADDLQIYRHFFPSEIADAVKKINEDIKAISAWSQQNKFVLNTNKTQALIIGSPKIKNRLYYGNISQVCVDDTFIPYSDSVQNLGITISSSLSWSNHVNNISRKINAILHQLKVHSKFLPQHTRKMLISSLVFPVIDYCCLVYNDLNEEDNTTIHRALNSCIRFIFKLRRDVHMTPYYNELRWLDVKTRRKYFLGSYLYCLFKEKSPEYLFDMFSLKPSTRDMSTRCDPEYLYFPSHRTTKFQKSFLVTACHL
jgi:hypothetical protein